MRPRLRGLNFTLLLLGALVGPALVAPSRALAAGSAPARVTLISAGKSPRSPLRLAITDGAVTSASMEFSESIKQSLDGTPTAAIDLPPIQFRVQTTVTSMSPNGDAHLSYAYPGLAVVDDGSLTAAQREQLESALTPLTSVTGTARLTARNQVFDSELSGTEGFDSTTAQLMSQVSDQIGSFAVPFPREAVGVGARWRGVSSLRVSGIDVRQTYEYTLLERDANRVVVTAKFTQSAPRQRAELPGVPKGTLVEVTSWRVSGAGSSSLDLAEPLPLESQSHAAGTQAYSVRAQGEKGTLTQKLAVDVKLSRPPIEAEA